MKTTGTTVLVVLVAALGGGLEAASEVAAAEAQPWERNGAMTVAVSADAYSNPVEHVNLVATLASLGYTTVDVVSTAEAAAAGACALVVHAGGYSDLGLDSAALTAWVAAGRGLVQIGEWHEYFIADYEGRLPTPTAVTVTITDSSHAVTQGVASSWAGRGFFYYAWPDGAYAYTNGSLGESDLATLEAPGFAPHTRGIAALDTAAGRAVFFGLNVYGPEAGPNELALLGNALSWVAEPVFGDGFESGDTDRWSAVTP